VPVPEDLERVTSRLAQAGFVAAPEEAVELLARAAGDAKLLDSLVERRLAGEPLAWVTGAAPFYGAWIGVDPGVYVPRRQSELVAERALERLPPDGAAVDVCTGAGPIAKTLMRHRPAARVVATDVDERAVACAASNGVEVYRGDLFEALPAELEGWVDVVVGIVPYVPTPELAALQRDTFAFETPVAYDGGPDGLGVVRRVLAESPRLLRSGGAVVLEIGGDQGAALREEIDALGYADVEVITDEDGDVRGIHATLGAPPATRRA
jgi:release factor glutamine methyltransferase